MEKPTRTPLVRSFEQHMRAENRSDRTIATYLHGLRQAETFLTARGTMVEAATRADLEAFMADLLACRTASTAATCCKILKVLYDWLVDEEELDTDPMAKMKPPIVPVNPVPVVPADGLKRLFAACAGTSFEARRDTALVMLLLDTGARRAEMVGLKLADVDLDLDVLLPPSADRPGQHGPSHSLLRSVKDDASARGRTQRATAASRRSTKTTAPRGGARRCP
jgi:site-specific recombinase XerD